MLGESNVVEYSDETVPESGTGGTLPVCLPEGERIVHKRGRRGRL